MCNISGRRMLQRVHTNKNNNDNNDNFIMAASSLRTSRAVSVYMYTRLIYINVV